ncbi:hypothetical protein FQZ97_942690 [compost metagenome]
MRTTAANAHHLTGNRLQQLNAASVVFFRKRQGTLADRRHDRPRRQRTGFQQAVEGHDALLERRLVTSGCSEQRHVEIGKGETGLSEVLRRVVGGLFP